MPPAVLLRGPNKIIHAKHLAQYILIKRDPLPRYDPVCSGQGEARHSPEFTGAPSVPQDQAGGEEGSPQLVHRSVPSSIHTLSWQRGGAGAAPVNYG